MAIHIIPDVADKGTASIVTPPPMKMNLETPSGPPLHCKVRDIRGKKYGRWLVVGYAGPQNARTYWDCICECGTKSRLDGGALRSGNTKSCGCLRDELARKNATTHGGRGTKEYTSWAGMRERCLNKRNHAYDDYGGRGITICSRWLNGEMGRTGYECFVDDMGQRPSGRSSIDRIDVNGNYEPSNCRWANAIEQANNRRTNINVTYEGHSGTLKSVCRKLGVNYKSVHRRLNAGWSLERAFETKRRAVA